jgi:hypothetical protein
MRRLVIIVLILILILQININLFEYMEKSAVQSQSKQPKKMTPEEAKALGKHLVKNYKGWKQAAIEGRADIDRLTQKIRAEQNAQNKIKLVTERARLLGLLTDVVKKERAYMDQLLYYTKHMGITLPL